MIMDLRNSSSGHCKKMIVATVIALLVSTLLGGPALADDLPALRQGLWKFQRTVGGEKIETTKCTSPTEDMKKMNAKLERKRLPVLSRQEVGECLHVYGGLLDEDANGRHDQQPLDVRHDGRQRELLQDRDRRRDRRSVVEGTAGRASDRRLQEVGPQPPPNDNP